MKLFGKTLFNKSTKDKLYDFAQHGLLRGTSNMSYGDYISINDLNSYALTSTKVVTPKIKKKQEEKPKELTPKEVYNLKTLHTDGLQINCKPEYIEENISILIQKLGLLPELPKKKRRKSSNSIMGPETDSTQYSRLEMLSMIQRLRNRNEFSKFGEDFSQWPYTTSDAISGILRNHSHLDAIECTSMISDLPKEAIDQINKYSNLVEELCQMKPVYYLIVEKTKKEDTQRRRDPILLAQSPFGFFWNILGAWDEEVKFLEEL